MPTKYLTPQEVADLLRVSPRTLEGWRSKRKGLGPDYVMIANVVRYDEDVVRRFLAERTSKG